MIRQQRRLSGLMVMLLLLTGCTQMQSPEPLEQVTLQLKWTHQSQFAGFYAADQNGAYGDEGMAVTMIEGGPEVDIVAQVLDGTAQFGITGADALLLAREAGQPVKAVAVIYQRSPFVFVSEKSRGIDHPLDMVGKTIRLTPDIQPTFKAMLANSGVPLDAYTPVNLPSDAALFGQGGADVWGAYLTSLVLAIKDAGYDLNVVYPDDYGVHFYGDAIFTTEALIASDPELVRRFLAATLDGWRYAVENPVEASELVLVYKPEADAALAIDQMVASVPLIHTGIHPIGWMTADTWQMMYTILLEHDVLRQPVDPDQVYTLEFLDAVYGGAE